MDSFRNLVPTGELGVRGRDLPVEERARILDELFFEGARRVPYLWRFAALMVFSSSIAAFGLLNDSSAVVIGAMLVAPLMTPLLGLAAASVQSWPRRQLESLGIVAVGAVIGIAIGWLAVELLPEVDEAVGLPDEVLARTAPNLLDLGIALAAGAAGAYVTVRKEAGSALPGVGIAVALVPPLATVGITIGVDRDDLAQGALLLFVTNLVCIVLAAGLVFLSAGFVPSMNRVLTRRGRLWSFAITVVALFFVAVPLTVHTANNVQEANARQDVTDAVEVWAPTATVEDVDLDVDATPDAVRVEISGPDVPGDPDDLARRIAEETGRNVEVSILFTPRTTGQADAGQ
jgi:uncharacterized hydrophobic protein (TIGR00271 family)